MNERIRELIVESGNGQMRDGRLYPHIGIRFEEDWQRFAQLIVLECAQIGEDTDGNWNVRYEILKHFGVEE